MRRAIIYTCILLITGYTAGAQYTMWGKIEYERKVSVKRMYSDLYGDKNNDWYESMKSKLPQSKSKFFNLYFNTDKSLYKPGKKVEEEGNTWIGSTPVDDDVVLSDFKKNKVISLKDLYGDKFVIEDSLKHIKWKLGSEIRTIANYKCRKAVAKMCDSVYIVAFYTDDIPASSGPEMFGGLPGMILEIAIPRLYTTWVATNVEITAPKENELTLASARGKKLTHQQMEKELQSGMKNRGDWGTRFIWWGVL